MPSTSLFRLPACLPLSLPPSSVSLNEKNVGLLSSQAGRQRVRPGRHLVRMYGEYSKRLELGIRYLLLL